MLTESLARGRTIPGLTGLRGVGAVWVVLYHLIGSKHVLVLERGYLGVDLFFILSGFVLSYVYASSLNPRDFGGYLSFLRARVFRIYPLHFVLLIVVAILVVGLPSFASRYSLADQRFSIGAFVASLLLIQNWVYWLPTCWNTPSWSLSAEWLAYLAFPAFLLATQRWRSAALTLILAAGSLLALYVLFSLKGLHTLNVEGSPALVRMACEFGCGCLLYRAIAIGFAFHPFCLDLISVSLLILVVTFPGAVFLAPLAFAMIVLSAVLGRGLLARAVSLRPVVFLGEISYSIYLVHWIVIQFSNWMLARSHLVSTQLLLWDVGLLLVIFALSIVTYRFIETPARAWGRRVRLGHSRAFGG